MNESKADSGNPSIGINKFYRRQTADSKYSFFDGADESLILAVQQNFPLRKSGDQEGSIIVPIPAKIGEGSFCYSAVVEVNHYSFMNARCIASSQNNGQYLIAPSVISNKQRAKYAEVILFSHESLKEIGENSTDKDYEIVSLNASDIPNPPEHPYQIAHKVLNNNASYTPQEICEAIIYWGTHAFAKTKFSFHADKRIAKELNNGNLKKAIALRSALAGETIEDAETYVNSLHNFMSVTGYGLNW